MRANSGRGHALIDRLVSLGSTVLYCTVQIQETDDSHHEGEPERRPGRTDKCPGAMSQHADHTR